VGCRVRVGRSAIARGPTPRKRSSRGPRNVSRAHVQVPTTRWAGKEPVPEYNTDSDTAPGYASDSDPLSGC
jgi:hypothetical protein